MTTTASTEAFHKPENVKIRWTHRKIISHFMQGHGESLTNREISAQVKTNVRFIGSATNHNYSPLSD